MKYNQPWGISDPNASYINGNPTLGVRGSIPPAASIENPQREIVNVLLDVGLAAPTDADLAQLSKAVRYMRPQYLVDTGAVNAIAVTMNPAPAAWPTAANIAVNPLAFFVTMAATNSNAAVTIAIAGLAGTKAVVKRDGTLPAVNDLVTASTYLMVFDGTKVRVAAMLPSDAGSGGASLFSVDALGGYINKFRNATCVVAGRGVSIVVPATGVATYTLDGYMVATGGATCTVSQVGSTPGARAPNGIQITGQAGVTGTVLKLPIESIVSQALASRSVVFQCKMLNNSGATITPLLTIAHPNGVDSWNAASTDFGAVPLQPCPAGALTQLSWSGMMPAAAANGLCFTVSVGAALGGPGRNVSFYDWDLREAAGVRIPELRDVSAELLQCARYLPFYEAKTVNNSITCGAMQNTYLDSNPGLANMGDFAFVFKTPTRLPVSGATLVPGPGNLSLTVSGIDLFATRFQFSNGGTASAECAIGDTDSTAWLPNDASNLGLIAPGRIYFTGAELNGSAI